MGTESDPVATKLSVIRLPFCNRGRVGISKEIFFMLDPLVDPSISVGIVSIEFLYYLFRLNIAYGPNSTSQIEFFALFDEIKS